MICKKNILRCLKIYSTCFIVLLTSILCSCNKADSESFRYENSDTSSVTVSSSDEDIVVSEAQQILSKMTLKEKVCQLFVVPPDDVSGEYNTVDINDAFLRFYNEYPVGGYILFEDNLKSPSQTKELLSSLNELSFNRFSLPVFLSIDEEGGKVTRIAGNDGFEVQEFKNMFYTESEEQAYVIGDTIGAYLYELGFNIDLAPVADVFSNSENEVIGVRSFSSDADTVCRYALKYAKGLNNNKIFATYKHFPGHGATKDDTHIDYAFTDKTYEELMQCELLPFKSAADNGIDLVMTSHISLPTVLGDNTPVTFSYEAITGILKQDLGFKGLIITDSLKMGAVSKHYTSSEIAFMSIKAGNDLLLMPQSIKEAVDGVLEAVDNGEITEDRINESVLKIIEYKLKIKK